MSLKQVWPIIVAATSLWLGMGGNAYAQTVDPLNLVSVEICNSTADEINVILIHQHRFEANSRTLRGWYQVGAKQCVDAGSAPRGQIFVFAEVVGGRLEWRGTAAYACLARRAIERTLYKDEVCVLGEARKGFYAVSALGFKTTIPF